MKDIIVFVCALCCFERNDSQQTAMIGKFVDVNAATANDLEITFHDYRSEGMKSEHIDYCFVD